MPKKVRVSAGFRDIFQWLAVVGGIGISIHAYLLLTKFELSGAILFLTYIELVVGLGTAIADTWFLMYT